MLGIPAPPSVRERQQREQRLVAGGLEAARGAFTPLAPFAYMHALGQMRQGKEPNMGLVSGLLALDALSSGAMGGPRPAYIPPRAASSVTPPAERPAATAVAPTEARLPRTAVLPPGAEPDFALLGKMQQLPPLRLWPSDPAAFRKKLAEREKDISRIQHAYMVARDPARRSKLQADLRQLQEEVFINRQRPSQTQYSDSDLLSGSAFEVDEGDLASILPAGARPQQPLFTPKIGDVLQGRVTKYKVNPDGTLEPLLGALGSLGPGAEFPPEFRTSQILKDAEGTPPSGGTVSTPLGEHVRRPTGWEKLGPLPVAPAPGARTPIYGPVKEAELYLSRPLSVGNPLQLRVMTEGFLAAAGQARERGDQAAVDVFYKAALKGIHEGALREQLPTGSAPVPGTVLSYAGKKYVLRPDNTFEELYSPPEAFKKTNKAALNIVGNKIFGGAEGLDMVVTAQHSGMLRSVRAVDFDKKPGWLVTLKSGLQLRIWDAPGIAAQLRANGINIVIPRPKVTHLSAVPITIVTPHGDIKLHKGTRYIQQMLNKGMVESAGYFLGSAESSPRTGMEPTDRPGFALRVVFKDGSTATMPADTNPLLEWRLRQAGFLKGGGQP